MVNYFPTHLAFNKAFCNRKKELARLINNIQGGNPTLILSPRRYGKTSLALNAFEKSKLAFTHIDFYKELNESDIERAILNGIGRLLGLMEKMPKKIMKIVQEFFSDLQVKVILENVGVSVDFSRREKSHASLIYRALDKLQVLAKEYNKKLVLYMDEFQILGEICHDHSIEAAIREAAQKSTHVIYVFSGSNRHLIEQMFYDKKRPFYKLCDIIHLDRISIDDYKAHIQKAALAKWDDNIPQQVIIEIMAKTERHPYYVNKLCSLLWQYDQIPTIGSVENEWYSYTLENKSITERELELLSINQRKLLIAIANKVVANEPYETAFTQQINMTPSSTQRALEALKTKDYIYGDTKSGYKILDPLLKSVLQLKEIY